MLKILKISILLLVGFCVGTNVYAGWSGPSELINESWGSADNQVGFKSGDTADSFPQGFWILGTRIVIRDHVNRRMKLYGMTGTLEKIVNWVKQSNGSYKIPEYALAGGLVGYVGEKLYTYYSPQKNYVAYSPTGQLINTSTTRTLDLGIVTFQKVGTEQYRSTVKYPDFVYQITSSQPVSKYYRDVNQKLYDIESFAENINDTEVISYKVHKYNKCSKEISLLSLPGSQYELMPPEAQDMPAWNPVPIMEYGAPIVSPGGDVYAWARTKTRYKVLKWTWVDDPNVPTGQDAPIGLTAMPSTNGIYLTWKASPNDPGCVTGYEIARATTSGGTFTTLPPIEKGVVKYNDTTAEAGQQYYYKVRAKAGSEYSPYTAEVPGKR